MEDGQLGRTGLTEPEPEPEPETKTETGTESSLTQGFLHCVALRCAGRCPGLETDQVDQGIGGREQAMRDRVRKRSFVRF